MRRWLAALAAVAALGCASLQRQVDDAGLTVLKLCTPIPAPSWCSAAADDVLAAQKALDAGNQTEAQARLLSAQKAQGATP